MQVGFVILFDDQLSSNGQLMIIDKLFQWDIFFIVNGLMIISCHRWIITMALFDSDLLQHRLSTLKYCAIWTDEMV